MGLESATNINGLVATNPLAGDLKSQGDDHLRLIKSVLQRTFPDGTAVYIAEDSGGSADTYTVAITNGVPTAYTKYMRVLFVPVADNTGASTLNVASLGAKSIVEQNGQALAPARLRTGILVEVVYDGTNFMLLSPMEPTLTPPQVRLDYTNSTTLTLSAWNGNRVPIKMSAAGWTMRRLTSSITLSNSGLTAATLYYIYLYDNAGTLTLEASTTYASLDSTTGFHCKNGDDTRLLVGFAYTDAGTPGTFANSLAKRYVLSYYNRLPLGVRSSNYGGTAYTLTAAHELDTTKRAEFLWLGTLYGFQYFHVSLAGSVTCSPTGSTFSAFIYKDGAQYLIASGGVYPGGGVGMTILADDVLPGKIAIGMGGSMSSGASATVDTNTYVSAVIQG